MKKIIYIVMITLFCGALVITSNKTNQSAAQEVEKEFKIINTYVNKSNNNIIEFNDNSYVVINHDKNIYEFYAAECGDYGIKAQDTKELKNILITYMINKYDISESELDKDNIFKNDILVSAEGKESNI